MASNNSFAELNQRFVSLTPREKGLLVIATLVSIFCLLFFLLIEPSMNMVAKLERQIMSAETNSKNVQANVLLSQAELAKDPNLVLADNIRSLSGQIAQLDASLQEQTSNLVLPRQMAPVLSRVLAKLHQLNVIEMTSIAPVAMHPDSNDVSKDTDVGLYQHGVRLVLEGRYFDVQKGLQEIETLPWQFYWKKFDYQVTQYPLAQVELELYTLSPSSVFIGV